ncbi:MAG: hypothetical protein WCI73_17345 [Phycisphaerae bacterium]
MKMQKKSLGGQLVGLVLAGTVMLAAGYWGGVLMAEDAATVPAGTQAASSAADKAKAIAHYHTARELFDQGKYQEAQAENEQALTLDKDLQDAKLLHLRLEARLSGTGPATTTTKAARSELLTLEQIHRVRVAELGDSPEEIKGADLRGSIPRKALDQFWEGVILKDATGPDLTQAAHDAFVNPSNFLEQVWRIKKSGDLKFMGQIKLDSDPPVLKAFKQKIQPYVLQNCATSGCHGGPTVTANGFHLYGNVGNVSDAQTYTNFYIMTTYSKGEAFMLDRQAPERSLFIQYALVKGANFVHPNNDKLTIKNRITGPEDLRYKEMTAVVKAFKLLQPAYGFTYPLPKKTATTEK